MANMKNTDARARLIGAMVDALQKRGLHGSGMTALLAAADAPKGVMYHHFPGGKTELAVAAIDATVARLCASLDAALGDGRDPGAALMAWIGGAQHKLDASNYERGCPLATIALETTSDDTAIRAALAAGFGALRDRIAAGLGRAGYAEAGARSLAALLVAAYEGGLLQARVAGRPEPMSLVRDALLSIMNSGALKGATK
ncbi:MAG: TetR/AcrR family transcriptional regulator [Pseudomonadota bacterium]